MMRRGAILTALMLASVILLAVVGAVGAGSPSPDPSGSAQPSQAPTVPVEAPASIDVQPSIATDEPAAPSEEPSPALLATPTDSPEPTATPRPEKATETPDADEVITTLTGVLATKKDADGDVEYSIGDVRLGVGPPWYWGERHPLAGLVGQTITVTGHMETGKPAKAGAKAKDAGPEFEVLIVNGTVIRAPGKPPWAGGPKAVGASHPGYTGWSKNHGKGNGAKDSDEP